MRTAARGVAIATVAALCACGGGGGGGGAGGDAGLVVTPLALTFSYVLGSGVAPAPSPQTITATWTADGAEVFGVRLPPGVARPAWLPNQTATLTGPKSGTVQITLGTTGVTAGVHTLVLQVGIGKLDGTVIAVRDVTVTYVVKAFGADQASITSSGVWGSSVAPGSRTVSLYPAATAWSASADRAWIRLNGGATASGTTPSTVTIAFDPAGLATGTHTGTVTFAGAGTTDAVAVTLTLASPALSVTPASVALAGLGGHDLSPKTIQVSLPTGTNAYPFTATADDPWIDVVQPVPTVAAAGATFTVAPAAAAKAWPPGTHAGTVTVTATVNGVPIRRTLAVGYQPDDVRLEVSDDAVMLTSTAGLSVLSRAVAVSTNRGIPASWTATSSEPGWLSVTPSGTTADPLVLTADPTGLAADTLYRATVTVSTADAGIADPTETVEVGLWVSAAAPAAEVTVASSFVEVVTDPLRPFAYVHDGGPAITVYDVLTGEVVGSISPVGTALGAMAVAGDGSRLFVVDGTSTRRVVPVDLATHQVGASWALPASLYPVRIAHARTNGVPVLATTAGTVHDPVSGTTRATFPAPGSAATIAASRDGSRLCTLNLGLSPYTVSCRALDATSTPGPSPVLVGPGRAGPWNVGGNGRDVALSPDGRRAYVASGAPYEVTVYDATTLQVEMPVAASFPASPYMTAVEVGPEGRIYAGLDATPSLRAYGPAGNALGSFSLGPVAPRQLAVSGDGGRVVALIGSGTANTALKIVAAPP